MELAHATDTRPLLGSFPSCVTDLCQAHTDFERQTLIYSLIPQTFLSVCNVVMTVPGTDSQTS